MLCLIADGLSPLDARGLQYIHLGSFLVLNHSNHYNNHRDYYRVSYYANKQGERLTAYKHLALNNASLISNSLYAYNAFYNHIYPITA